MPIDMAAEFPLRQVVNPEGELVGDRQTVSDDQIRQFLRQLVILRTLDQRAWNLQRQGRIGTYAPFSGHEAIQVASGLVLEPGDWVAASYRDWALLATLGVPLSYPLLNAMGHPVSGKIPEPITALPVQVVIAAQILHAVGLAWAQKLRQTGKIAATFFGDGATSQGDFHEALNLAAVKAVPAVFVCENNQWAISVPLRRQTHSETIAQKALAYGMRGVRVDGNDMLAMYLTMKEVVTTVRQTKEPVLVEAVTYRLGAHTTSDDPTRYRPSAEEEAWMAGEPVTRLKKFALNAGLVTESDIAAMEAEAKELVEQAVREAEGYAPPDPAEAIFDHVYATKPFGLAQQQEAFRHRLQEGGQHG